MKKLLIPIVALLAFSMLSTSVSAIMPDYYMASFYGEASGTCKVTPAFEPEVPGKGSFYIRGLAVVREYSSHYRTQAGWPDTRLWTRGTSMTVSWGTQKVKVFIWPRYDFFSDLYNGTDVITIIGMSYFGYYKSKTGLQFIWGKANIEFTILRATVYLRTGPYAHPFFTFEWSIEVAREFRHGVTVWGPIPWHPSGP